MKTISKRYKSENIVTHFAINPINPMVRMKPRDAYYNEKESLKLEDSLNRICGENIMAYPPGIPVISPGEIITREVLDYIKVLKSSNAHLTDMCDKTLETILVIKE